MTIEFHCPACSKLLRTSDEKAGVTAKCPQCGGPITVPSAAGGRPGEPLHAADDDYGGVTEEYASPPPVPSRSGSGGGTKPCPMCGETIQAAAVRCRFCGENIGGPRMPAASAYSHLRPHRAGMILAFGILGWAICPIFSILAVVMGNQDLREIAAGTMDPSGEGMTKAGKIIGLVQIILVAVMLAFYCVVIIIMAAAGGLQ